jgi:hypothetical protein
MNPLSAATSIDQVPALHKFVSKLGVSLFDFGAGKKGKIDEFYASRKFIKTTLFYDPFNREQEENQQSMDFLLNEGVDALTCANVLNVIEDEHLDGVMARLAALTLQTFKGICFVSVYYNAKLPKNRTVRGHFQRNEPIGWYAEKLKEHFKSVDKIGSFLICSVDE